MTLEISLEPDLEALLHKKAAAQGQDLNKLVAELITHALHHESVSIIRTERGLTIQGTRITLYDVMDYLTAGYSHEHIRNMLRLTPAQWSAAQAYIEQHHTKVIGEYHQVLEQAEESRQYWENHNRELLTLTTVKPDHEMTMAHKKLQDWKNRLNSHKV